MEAFDADHPIKEYTGVWMPAFVLESKDLSLLEKLLYAEMAGFDVCYASNKWFAEKLDRSEVAISRAIANLVQLGYVENLGFNGRFRQLRVIKNDKADLSKMIRQTYQKRQHNNKVNIKVETSTKVDGDKSQDEAVEKSEYGNHQVNAILELWEHETGITANVAKANRLAAYNLIRRRGFDGAKHVVELCGRAIRSGDRYAPSVASFRDLQGRYEKLSRLEAWEARQAQEAPAQVGLMYSELAVADCQDEKTEEQREATREAIRRAREKLGFVKKGGSL